MSFVKYVLSLVFIMAIAACGGGGGSAGTSSGSAVVVAPLITTAPAALTVAVGAVQDYRISGGKAPYQVSSSNVQVSVASVSDTNLKITGIATGSSNVVVTDSAGVTTAVAVTVGNLSELFSNAPSTVNLSPSTNASFTVGGGVPGYSVSTTDARIASASLSGTTIFINAIAVGNATITVRDASGKTKDIPVVVGSLIALYTTAPSSFTIAKDSQRNFTVSGGVPGYSVESVDTRIVVATLTGASLNIRGVAVGSANVLIRDTVNSQLLTLNVTVGGDSPLGLFTSAPGSLIVVKDSQTTYSVGGGVAGYSVESSDRRIATASVSGSSIVINAIALGATTITIRDAAGTSLNIALTVGSSNPGAFFTSAPSALSLSTGTSLSYSISGGAQPYSVVSSDARVVVGNISGATVIITALKAGTAALQIADATGKTLPIVVTADGTSAGAGGPAGIEVLSSSSSLTSAVGSKVTFVVTAKDAVNTGIPNQIVTFTASSGTLTGANPSPSTDVNGSITTISLSPGADLSNRTITVTATAGSVSKSINIPVVGT
ncbi:MAG: hypothetical protein Q8K22_07360, partial [Rhodoferax sp.]|nr:hypothetical protein [Rhodoferax sp.]